MNFSCANKLHPKEQRISRTLNLSAVCPILKHKNGNSSCFRWLMLVEGLRWFFHSFWEHLWCYCDQWYFSRVFLHPGFFCGSGGFCWLMKRKKRVSGEVLRMSSLLREYLVFLFAASSLWSLTSIPYVVWASVHAGHPAELCDVGHVPSLRRPQLWHWALQGPAGKMAIAAMEIFFTFPLFLFFFYLFFWQHCMQQKFWRSLLLLELWWLHECSLTLDILGIR